MRDVPWEDIFKLGASAAASEFCEWIQVGIDVYIPHRKYQVKSHSSPWFSAACAAAIVHRNHFFRLYQREKSSDSKVKFRQASNRCKRVLEAVKLAYANKTKESITHYGIRGKANDWFKSFLVNRNQYTSINNTNSTSEKDMYGVPQGSVLGPLLFVIFINDLHVSVRNSKVHHFADDTNLLLISKSLKQINKLINHDISLLVQWLRSNKISLNTSKTKILIFRPKGKLIMKPQFQD